MKSNLIQAIASGDMQKLKTIVDQQRTANEPIKQYEFQRISEITSIEVDMQAIAGGSEQPLPNVKSTEIFKCNESGTYHTYGQIIKMFSREKTMIWHGMTGADEPILGIAEIMISSYKEIDVESLTSEEKLSVFRALQRQRLYGKDKVIIEKRFELAKDVLER